MGTTPNRSYRFPASSDDPGQLAVFIENLADDVDTDAAALWAELIPNWVPITSFGSNWSAYGTAFSLAYWVTPTGHVRLRGAPVCSTTVATGGVTMCTLPAAARPASAVRFASATNSSVGGAMQVAILTTGQVQVFATATLGTGAVLSLDTVDYWLT